MTTRGVLSISLAALGLVLLGCGFWLALSIAPDISSLAVPILMATVLTEPGLLFEPKVWLLLLGVALLSAGSWSISMSLPGRRLSRALLAWGAVYLTLTGIWLRTERPMGIASFSFGSLPDLAYHAMMALGAMLLLRIMLRSRIALDLWAVLGATLVASALNYIWSWDGPMLHAFDPRIHAIFVWPLTGIALYVGEAAVIIRTIRVLIGELRVGLTLQRTDT